MASAMTIQKELKAVEASLKRELREIEMRLLIRLGALMMAGIGIVATLVKIL